MADFKVYILCWYACNEKLMVNYETPEQYLGRFLIFIIVRRHMTFKVRVLQGVYRQYHMIHINPSSA